MKKERSPILVIFCMFLLLLLIVVPPVFRKFIPKKEETKQITKQKHINILMCTKTFSDNIHKASSKVKYVNDIIDTNTIIFDLVEYNSELEAEAANNTSLSNSNQTYEEEYQILTNMNNANIVTENNKTTIVINKEIADNNLNSEGVNTYFQPLKFQKEFYENLDYICDVIES